MHLHKSVRDGWTTGLQPRRQPAFDKTETSRWAAEGIFLLQGEVKGSATCPLRLVFIYCCTLGICTQISLRALRDVLAVCSNKRISDALGENCEIAEEKATGMQADGPVGLTRTAACLEHLKPLLAMPTAEVTALTARTPVQKATAFLWHLLHQQPTFPRETPSGSSRASPHHTIQPGSLALPRGSNRDHHTSFSPRMGQF